MNYNQLHMSTHTPYQHSYSALYVHSLLQLPSGAAETTFDRFSHMVTVIIALRVDILN